jgi:hypothetical protein
MAFELPILDAKFLLVILCRTTKCGRIPSILGAQNPLFGIYIGVISLGAITLPV